MGCSGGAAADTPQQTSGETSGPAYTEPTSIPENTFNDAAAVTFAQGAIDVSGAAQGYVAARATAPTRLKLQVIQGEMSYNYDMPTDGTPIFAPVNMGNGTYTVRVMQNTSGTSYAELGSTTAEVQLESEFAPWLRPNIFCDYTAQSACVQHARDLAADAENEGDVVRAIYDWITSNITYDDAKAAQLATTTGYIPHPDETLSSGEGVCFDYSSLAAAMLRSLGIPCQIVTGYVSPDDIYHAWNMIYINGEWVSARIVVNADEWCRMDTTFAAAQQGNQLVGDGETYTDRYTY